MSCPERPKIPNQISNEHCEKGCVHWFDMESKLGEYCSIKARPHIVISRTSYSSDKVQISPITDIAHKIEKGKLKYPYHAALYKKDNPFFRER